MRLSKLYVQDFRQFTQATWELSDELNLIVGANGAGKTTILEACYLLATAKSFRAGKTGEMLRFGQEVSRVYGLLDDGLRLGVTLTGGMVGGKRTSAKSYMLDKAKKRQRDYVGHFLATCFRPEDLRLIEGSSGRRRSYLDTPLLLTSDVYRQAYQNYQAVLLRRNKTLLGIKNQELPVSTVEFYNQQLCQYGQILTNLRREYVDFLNQEVAFVRPLKMIYQPNLATMERVRSHLVAEIAIGHSLVGPHKDNFLVQAKLSGQEVSLATYGSRGQQRLAVLWLKLGELAYLERVTAQKPVLLLDDIFSELDEQAQMLVLTQMDKQQTLLTTTDENVVKLVGEVKVIKL